MRFFKFAAVGLINTGIHFAILTLLVSGLNLAPEIGNTLAFAFANIFSYIFNTRWTFQAKVTWSHYMRFLVTSLVGLVLSFGLMKATVLMGWPYQVGFLAQCVLMPLINYTLVKHLVFKTAHRAP